MENEYGQQVLQKPGPVNAIVLQIVHDPATGAVNVAGPIENTMLCLAMLEMAKEAILAVCRARGGKLVQPASQMPGGPRLV